MVTVAHNCGLEVGTRLTTYPPLLATSRLTFIATVAFEARVPRRNDLKVRQGDEGNSIFELTSDPVSSNGPKDHIIVSLDPIRVPVPTIYSKYVEGQFCVIVVMYSNVILRRRDWNVRPYAHITCRCRDLERNHNSRFFVVQVTIRGYDVSQLYICTSMTSS